MKLRTNLLGQRCLFAHLRAPGGRRVGREVLGVGGIGCPGSLSRALSLCYNIYGLYLHSYSNCVKSVQGGFKRHRLLTKS